MQITKSISIKQEKKTSNTINNFLTRFGFSKILHKAKVTKRGAQPQEIIQKILELPFIQKLFYQGIKAYYTL